MLDWLKRRDDKGAMVSLCPAADGIAAAAISLDNDQQPVLDWLEFHPVPSDVQRSDELSSWARRHKLGQTRTSCLLPISDYSLVSVEAPNVPDAELRAAVRWQVKDLIDFDIEDAVVDVVKMPPLKGGRENKLYAVVARRSAVLGLVTDIEAAEIALEIVDIPEFALRNIASLLAEDVGGLAFVYLDDDAGIITITRQQQLFLSRRFDAGRARLLAAQTDDVSPEIEGLLDAIVIEVQRSLDYYESQYSQPPVQGVVLAPLGREIRGLDSYLSSQLGIPVRVLGLADLIELSGEISAEDQARCITAVGAALRVVTERA